MSDEDARRLERILKRDGRLHDFVLQALEGFGREDLGLILDRTMELMKQKTPAAEALKRGLADGERLQRGEVTPDELVEELQARPLQTRPRRGIGNLQGRPRDSSSCWRRTPATARTRSGSPVFCSRSRA
jgi:hypothetical protein